MKRALEALTGILASLTVGVFGLTVFSGYYSIFGDGNGGQWADCAGLSFVLTVFLAFGTGTSAVMLDDR